MLSTDLEDPYVHRLGHRVRIELAMRLLGAHETAKFPPELEAEYRDFHGERVLSLLRIALLLIPVIYVTLFALDWFFSRSLERPLALALCLGVSVPSSVLLYYLVLTPGHRLLVRRLSPWNNLLNGLVIIFLSADSNRHGQVSHYEYLALAFAYTFFLGGLKPRDSALVAGTLIIVDGLSVAWSGLSGETIAWQLYFLAALGILGWLGAWMLDRSQRRFWLQNVLTTELSISDGLTGLHNHRHLKEQGDIVLRHAARELRSVALMLIDVDYFKAFNDSQGHLAGDECLRRIGRVIEPVGRRPLDVAARYGGEEFAVLMYDCLEPQAQRRAEEVREAIYQLKIDHPGSPLGYISVSIGVAAAVPVMTSQLESFTRMADLALYQAKARGRNRVESGTLA